MLLALLACLGAGGCHLWRTGPEADLDAWVANDMVALTEHTPRRRDVLICDAAGTTVTLDAAANETVSFQVVVDVRSGEPAPLTVAWSALAAGRDTIDASNITAFRGWPVRVTHYPPWYLRLVDEAPRPTGFYDALVPLAAPRLGQPFGLKAGERLALWVDVHVPRTARAGRYTGRLAVRSGEEEAWSIALAVNVYDFVLPDARPIAAVGGFDHQALFAGLIRHEGQPYVPTHLDRRNPVVRRGLTALRHLMTLAHRHRIDLFDQRIRPLLKRDMFGKVHLDWDDYDAIVLPYLEGTAFEDRLGVPAWPVPLTETWPDPAHYGGRHSDAYATTVGGLLVECRRHFAGSLESAERMFIWPYRGEIAAGAYEPFARLARIARAADRDTPILCQLPQEPPKLTGWRVPEDMKALVDIAAPRAEWFDPLAARLAPRPEHRLVGVWLSPGTPPYLPSLGVIATPADVRAIPWFAAKYHCTGLFLPEVLHWGPEPFEPTASAQTRLFYPGTIAGLEEALPSVRLKRLRRGLQDIMYLWVLQQRQRSEVARTVTDAMARYAGLNAAGDHYLDPRLDGWVQDPAAWDQARRLLAAEILDVVHPSPASTARVLEQRLAWRQFDEATHRVRVEQVRTRVAPVRNEAGQADLLEMTVLLDLYNEHSRTVDVLARIEALPEGWTAVRAMATLAPFRAGGRAVLELTARGTHVPGTAAGKLTVPVSLTTNRERRQAIDAAVPFLIAEATGSPPVIDGRLDDWPMRVGNVAGAFKLVGRRGRTGEGLAQRQTLTFALRDDKNLYLAFRCEEPDLLAVVAQPSNIIHYEQLMACGEDLVEVVLDPGADAAGPGNLYHAIVKANGVLLTERGVHTDPPLGQAGPWPVAAAVAVGRQEDAWVVEMAIPLASFGEEAKARFWGANFTRFATQGAEASSWSGAPRYFYDPRNLGTMFLPAVAAD